MGAPRDRSRFPSRHAYDCVRIGARAVHRTWRRGLLAVRHVSARPQGRARRDPRAGADGPDGGGRAPRPHTPEEDGHRGCWQPAGTALSYDPHVGACFADNHWWRLEPWEEACIAAGLDMDGEVADAIAQAQSALLVAAARFDIPTCKVFDQECD